LLPPGHAESGKHVFQRCIVCHYADREGNKAGPSLKNVSCSAGQRGTESGYRFSAAMVKAAENSLVWNKQTLADYLHNPQDPLGQGNTHATCQNNIGTGY